MAVAVARQTTGLLSSLTRVKGILFTGPSGSGKTTLLGMVKDKAIIVDIFLKKTQKTPKKKIEKALRRLKEYS